MLDRDLSSIQQARDLVESASRAQETLATFTQEQIDSIVEAMANAAYSQSERLGELAVQETGFGIPEDKAIKNKFASKNVHDFFKTLRTVGVVRDQEKLIEVAEPLGTIAAIIPSTNPTSTTIFKALISIKSRNAVVLSPHPSAVGCITETVRIVREAGEARGLPQGTIGCLTISNIAGTDALMKHDKTAIILATGGTGLVKAAYSSGKPAFGVGPGNVPALIERSANIPKAVADILAGKTFDNGTVCASEQSVVVEQSIDSEVRKQFELQGGYFLNSDDAIKLAKLVVLPNFGLNPAVVGRSVQKLAEMAGINVPTNIRVLMVELDGVGKEFPLSLEKLSPILTYYVAPDFKTGSQICAKILRYGGMGHSVGIHSQSREKVCEFGILQPASRILVNTPTTHGAIGFSTELSPSMTLGCGSWGGNVTSDNISPLHLMNLKRIAFETFPVSTIQSMKPASLTISSFSTNSLGDLMPDRAAIAALVDKFLSEKKSTIESILRQQIGSTQTESTQPKKMESAAVSDNSSVEKKTEKAVDFVCEEDIRAASLENRKIIIDKKTIITPAARDLGRERNIFVGYEL